MNSRRMLKTIAQATGQAVTITGCSLFGAACGTIGSVSQVVRDLRRGQFATAIGHVVLSPVTIVVSGVAGGVIAVDELKKGVIRDQPVR